MFLQGIKPVWWGEMILGNKGFQSIDNKPGQDFAAHIAKRYGAKLGSKLRFLCLGNQAKISFFVLRSYAGDSKDL